MFAHPFMRRTALVALAFAGLMTVFAVAAPSTASGRRRKTETAAARRGRILREHRQREARLEAARRRAHERYEAVLHARYEDGYKAGFAAGVKAGRAQAASTGAIHPDSQPQASRPMHSDPAGATVAKPRLADATVHTASPAVAGDRTVPGADHPPLHAESASLGLAPGPHQVPVTLKASLEMLHERFPPPLRGSLASLERQNRRLDEEGLQRIEDNSDLRYRIAQKLLVPLPVSAGLTVNPRLPVDRRYCRPWTSEFLSDLAAMHEAVFHRPLEVDSAVRTVDYQRRLERINANAAPAEGAIASPHETGATIDITKKGMNWREIGWMRRYLLTLQNAGLIDVEEEFYQACFHITVYDNYGRKQRSTQPVETATPSGSVSRTASSAGADGPQGQ